MPGNRLPACVADEDPRLNPRCVSAVPSLLREGAAHYNGARFWDAHEAWETAWHSLRAAREADQAAYVRGLILVTAAFENATRGKGEGSKRQLAEGLHALLSHPEAAAEVGVQDAETFHAALVRIHLDMARRRRWEHWHDAGWKAPPLALVASDEDSRC